MVVVTQGDPDISELLALADHLVRTAGWLRREVEREDLAMARSYAAAAVRRARTVAAATEAWGSRAEPPGGRPGIPVSLAGEDATTAVHTLSDGDLRSLHDQLSWDLHQEKRVGPAEWLRAALADVKAEMDRRGSRW
ncbi:hypothetical protein [Phycicoccus avicenniae]|uniref:hypothetical protein n=1 Tax=Phycicoccus avicenniae TaxID=2828860 RepID=UPI003D2E6BB8